MKNLLKIVSAGFLLCLLCAMPAVAQIVNGMGFTTTFAFYAGNTKLPAGTYKVTPTNFGSTMLMIENSNGSHSAFFEFTPTQADAGHKTSDVAFRKYGNVECLSRLWIAGQTYGMMLEPTKFEQSLAAKTPPQTHSITGTAK